jgi:hypothetical protein
MNKIKSIWTTITGSISSVIPLFFACCKSGACASACVSPVASIFGISSASFTASPLFNAIVPLLLALSAISFTISYYNLYVLPKRADCNNDCNCDTPQNKRKEKVSKWIFWIGLLASIFFFTYFEIQKYKAENVPAESSMTIQNNNPETSANDSLNSADTTTVQKKCCSSGSKCE